MIRGHYNSGSSGFSVSRAGDLNGDGLGDMVIGGPGVAGQSYVVFGSTDPFGSSLELSGLDGNNGFVINGEKADDQLGRSVAAAGDFNGDGLDDLLVGATGADPIPLNAGAAYLVFGTTSGFPANLNVSDLDGTNGFAVAGNAPAGGLGFRVSPAGDINHDNLDDVLIGSFSGPRVVVFGQTSMASSRLDITALDGSNGFIIHGVIPGGIYGSEVSTAGDVNGDGVDDILIGDYKAFSGPNAMAGKSYVIFGGTSGFSSSLQLTSLNGSNGFSINGIDAGDQSGFSLHGGGDFNRDGLSDLIIGAVGGNPNGTYSGESYLVFGNSSGFSSSFDLSSLDGVNGVTLNGIDAVDASGRSVRFAGDVDGDGADDLIIGAFYGDPNGLSQAGEGYIVFGTSSPLGSHVELSSLNGNNGFVINGIDPNDQATSSVSSAGDINGDGASDILIGAHKAFPNGISYAGETYVIFGVNGGSSGCVAPTGLAAASIDHSSASVSWNDVGGLSYKVRYKIEGAATWRDTTVTSTSLGLTNLVPETNYLLQARANCSSVVSSWSSSSFMTTAESCVVPSGQGSQNTASSSTELNWDDNADRVSFDVRYKVSGAGAWNVLNVDTSGLTLTGLNSETDHVWQNRSVCETKSSNWASLQFFTTLAETCDIPGGLSPSNIDQTSADLSWNPVQGAVSYDVRYKINGSSTWTQVNTPSTSWSAVGLVEDAGYVWQVKTRCSSISSAWSSLDSFATSPFTCPGMRDQTRN